MKRNQIFTFTTASLAMAMLCSGSLSGQEATESNPFGPWYMQDYEAKWWRVELLLGVGTEPTYPGSNESELEVGGLARVVLKDPWNNRYFLDTDGVSAAFDLTDDLVFAAEIEIEEADDSVGPDDFPGLDEAEETVEGQFTLAKRWGDTYLFGALQPDLLGRGKGLVWFAGGGHDWDITEDLSWRNRLSLSGGNNTHMDTEFQITPAESSATGFSEFDPSAGMKSVDWDTSVEYRLNDSFSLYGGAQFELALGDAADNPLVRDEGSDFTVEALVGVLFRW